VNKNAIPIDWNILRAATDGDEAAIQELSAIYLQQGIKRLKKLRSAVLRKDSEQVTEVAHAFLGSSRFFGASGIGKPLAALLKMGRAQRLGPTAAQLMDRTEKEFARIDYFFKTRRKKTLGRPAHA